MPGLLDMLRRNILAKYPNRFLISVSAVRVYLKARWGGRGWIEQTGLTVNCLTLLLLNGC